MKMIFATIDEVPENLRKDAVLQEDGSYVLEGDGSKGILAKNAELLADNKKHKAIADKFKDLPENADAATIKRALADLADEHKREDIVNKRITDAVTDAVKNAAKEWEPKIASAETNAGKMRKALESQIIDKELVSAVAAEKGDTFFVVPQLRNRVKAVEVDGHFVARVVDDKGNVRVGSKGDPITIQELVSEAKKDKQFARVFDAPAASGSGAPGDTSGTPKVTGAEGTVTLTRTQGKDARQYQAALASVKGDFRKVIISEG